VKPDPLTELHALAVLDVLEAAQELVDEWRQQRVPRWPVFVQLEDALTRLDRLEVVQAAA
jgi:hypothetical protein